MTPPVVCNEDGGNARWVLLSNALVIAVRRRLGSFGIAAPTVDNVDAWTYISSGVSAGSYMTMFMGSFYASLVFDR